MAAPIKMDELLVSWLGSDEVYENVMSLIEKYRVQRKQQEHQFQLQQEQQQQQQATSVEESEKALINKTGGTVVESSSSSGASSSRSFNNNPHDGSSSPKTVIVIPPFYPLKLPGTGKALPRRRRLPRPSETWDPLPPPEPDGLVFGSNNGELRSKTNTIMDTPDDEQNQDFFKNDNSNAGGTNTTAMVCVRDQVLNMLNELDIKSTHTHNSGPTSTMNPNVTIPSQANVVFTMDSFVRITKEVCQFPSFFNQPLYQRILDLWNDQFSSNSNSNSTVLNMKMLEWFWKTEMEPYDAPERFFRLVKQPENDCILRDDFLPYIKALLNDHPGLEFLSNHAEFQEKYAVTVITRIFYSVNKCHSGRITSRQVRRSDLLRAFSNVDEEEDINKVTRYFSYEHFYVLYCRFWELDHDRDYRITREDLLKYGDHSLSHMIVDRIFDAAPRPFCQEKIDREYLSYEDFIYFMLSEEDKANDVSVRYWFNCVDVDGDSKLNNMEMRSFYAVQLHRMQCMGHEIVPFEDMLCQMMDMIKPSNSNYLVVEDFLQPECCQVSGALFDALFNLNKYLMFEQRDPFVERQKREDEFDTDWDRFACIDYNRLAMEEEAREEEAMEIDWVTVDDEEDEDPVEYNRAMTTEAPF